MTEPTCGHAEDEIWGACAEVFIASDLDLDSLAAQIASTLQSIDFWFDTDMDPPHEWMALADVLGWSLDLSLENELEGFNYSLVALANHAGSLIPRDRMFDLSPWLARYLRDIAHLEVSPTEGEVTGAKAEAHLASDLDLRALAAHLSKVLAIDMRIDTDMDPPHEEFAMAEALGFEMWLYHSADIEGFNYHFSMETMHSHDALFADRMVDLSHWLESYLLLIGGLTVAPLSCTAAPK